MSDSESAPTFETAILPHVDAAYNFARWLLRDPDEAADATQDAFLRALEHFATFRGGDARGWLLRIVRNACYQRLRSRRGEVVSLGEGEDGTGLDVPDSAPSPEATLSYVQDVTRLESGLATLPVPLRETLVLCEMEQLSYKDIARITDVPIGTVMSRLWRARQTLMRLMAPECAYDNG